MLRKDLGALTMMGFARYRKSDGVESEELVDACLEFRHKFLDHQNGIAFHCFLGNLRGDFADVIMATDRPAFEEMSRRRSDDESAQAFVALLDAESIRLTPNLILKENVSVPSGFSSIEFGTFRTRPDADFKEAAMLETSDRIEKDYLSAFPESREHFLGKVSDGTYSEVAFVENLGAARSICNGYLDNPVCGRLLSMFEPDSVDLDFWFVLA